MSKGDKVVYNLGVTHTIYPDGSKDEYKPSKKPTEVVKEVANWRIKTNTF